LVSAATFPGNSTAGYTTAAGMLWEPASTLCSSLFTTSGQFTRRQGPAAPASSHWEVQCLAQWQGGCFLMAVPAAPAAAAAAAAGCHHSQSSRKTPTPAGQLSATVRQGIDRFEGLTASLQYVFKALRVRQHPTWAHSKPGRRQLRYCPTTGQPQAHWLVVSCYLQGYEQSPPPQSFATLG